jgi:hypothetical protein
MPVMMEQEHMSLLAAQSQDINEWPLQQTQAKELQHVPTQQHAPTQQYALMQQHAPVQQCAPNELHASGPNTP